MRIVTTNGCFDILHAGHVDFLNRCKALGDKLVVGLNSDASVRRLKGPTRPINSQTDRARMLESLRSVDEVQIFEEDDPCAFIRAVKPHIHVKGSEYQGKDIPEKRLCEALVLLCQLRR